MNIIVIIDCWNHLIHPLEQEVKKNILKFLDKNRDYFIINGCYQSPCDVGLLNYLDKNNDRLLKVDIEDCDWSTKYQWTSYTICGFHSLQCLIYRPLGLYEIMKKNLHRHKDITIRYDLSCSNRGRYEYITWSKNRIKKMLKFPNSPVNIITKSR